MAISFLDTLNSSTSTVATTSSTVEDNEEYTLCDDGRYLIYSNYSITDWTENDVLTWLHRIGINDNRYDDIIVENSINGLKFLKLSFNELKEYKIDNVRDVKLILKSLDFLRIFVRFQLSFSEKIEKQKNDNNTFANIAISLNQNSHNFESSNNLIVMSNWHNKELLRKSYSNNTLPLLHPLLI